MRRHELLVSPSVTAEVGEHGLRNGVPEHHARLVIDPRVLSRVDPAQAGLAIALSGQGFR